MQDGEQAIILPVTLHRRSFWEIIGDTFQVYRDNFRTLFVISAVLTTSLSLLNFIFTALSLSSTTEFFTSSSPMTQMSAFYAGCFLCCGGIFFFAIVLAMIAALNGTITFVTSEAQFGHRLSAREAWERTKPLVKKYSLALIFYGIRIVAICSAVFFLTLCGGGIGVAFIGIAIYFAITFGSLLGPVVVFEKLTPRQSITRAHQLTLPRFWQIAALFLLYGGLSLIIMLPLMLLSGFDIRSPQVTFTQTLISIGVGVFLTPLLPIALTLMYYDARIRSENLDLALQAMGVEARPGDVIPPESKASFFDAQNLINMGIFLVIGIIFFVLVRQPFINWLEALIETRRTLPGRPMT